MRSQPVALLFLIVLLSASVASAECAWVLWEEVEDLLPSKQSNLQRTWKIHRADRTLAECESVMRAVWEVRAKQFAPGPDKPGIESTKTVPHSLVGTTFKSGDVTLWTFRCLPDTVDPRPR